MFNPFRKDHPRSLADSKQPTEAPAPESAAAPATEQVSHASSSEENLVGSLPDIHEEQADQWVDEVQPAVEAETGNEVPSDTESALDESGDLDDADSLEESDDEELADSLSDAEDQEPEPGCNEEPEARWNEVPRQMPPALTARRPRDFLQDLQRAKKKAASAQHRCSYTPQQRLLILDTWQRSGLPAADFAELVSVSKHTLYKWKKVFERLGPEGLMDQPKGKRTGSRLSELTKRTILMLKAAHPEWGVQRISDMLTRGPGLSASGSAIARVLREAGYQSVSEPTEPNRPPKVVRFERAKPNQLWQTDLFTFMLKRQNRRLYLVAFMDDHSRFVVSYGLHASATTPLVLEVLEAGIANYGPPQEILTDNGPQYITWRGKSRFTRQLEKRGIKQIVAKPRRPQTLGKIERFWGTLWRELLECSIFVDLADARERVGHFIDYYNFQRAHRGVDGLVPADRFFGAAADVLRTLKERVAGNALELARHGKLKAPFYVTGQVSGQSFSVHSEGERLVLNRQGQQREEIELVSAAENPQAQQMPHPLCPQGIIDSLPGEPAEADPPAPGESAVDGFIDDLQEQGGQS